MSLWVFFLAATLLSFERLCYVWVSRAPDAFRSWCAQPAVAYFGEPVAIVQKLFYGFKGIQVIVFLGWCFVHGNVSPWPLHGDVVALVAGGALLGVGQILNWSVFYRLGTIGIFYGSQLGYEVSWCRAFPFSFLKHPQYIGTVLSIWGFFLVMRFPYNDWYVLPALETVYYVVGAYCEP